MINEIYLVTSNKHKLREFQEILGFPIKSVEVESDEIQEVDGEKVVTHKAEEAFRKLGKPLIVDDTGIFLEALKGFPGVLGKWMDKTCGFEVLVDLAKLYQNPKAWAKTFIGFCDGRETKVFVGEVEGRIAETVRGESGFGFDPIFIPKGFSKTQAEMGSEGKKSDLQSPEGGREAEGIFGELDKGSHLCSIAPLF